MIISDFSCWSIPESFLIKPIAERGNILYMVFDGEHFRAELVLKTDLEKPGCGIWERVDAFNALF